MPRWLGWVAGGVALVELGWIIGATTGNARAQEAVGDAPVAAEAPAPATPPDAQDRLCRAFATPADRPGDVDTSDRTTAIGQWVGPLRDKGWRVSTVDFEIGTKPTGYPQPWVEVCLAR